MCDHLAVLDLPRLLQDLHVARAHGGEEALRDARETLERELARWKPDDPLLAAACLVEVEDPALRAALGPIAARARGRSASTRALVLDRHGGGLIVNLEVEISPGGRGASGLGIVDTMRFIPNDVSTFVIGQAASMGSVIACSGAKGKRFCLPNSENLMHQPLLNGVLEGQATDLEIEARHILRMRDQIYHLYHEQTGQTAEKVAEDCERNNWLTATQMVEYGLADEVLEHLPQNTGDKKAAGDD